MRPGPVLLGTALALTFAACSRPGAVATGPLPADGEVAGWSLSGAAEAFAPPELYGQIDGGAEVFLELGFDRLDLQRYASGGHEVALELYWMTDPTAALGVYLLKCGRETPDPALADRNTVNPYQAQLVRGRVYLVVSRLQGEPPAEAMVGLARLAASRLEPGDGSAAFAALPSPDRVAGSERVVRGPFTLQEVVTLGEGDVLQLGGRVTAVAARYQGAGGEVTRLVASYPDQAAAASALASVREHLDPYLELLLDEPERLVLRDHRGRYGTVARVADRLELALDRVEPPPQLAGGAPGAGP